MEHWWDEEGQEKAKYLEESSAQLHLVYFEFYIDHAGFEPVPQH
jgi:hypothetical protein